MNTEQKIDLILEAMRTSPQFRPYIKALLDAEIKEAVEEHEYLLKQYKTQVRELISEAVSELTRTEYLVPGRFAKRVTFMYRKEDAPDYMMELIKVVNDRLDECFSRGFHSEDFSENELLKTQPPTAEHMLTLPAFRAECERRFGPRPNLEEKIETIKNKYV